MMEGESVFPPMKNQFSRRDALKAVGAAGTIAIVEGARADTPESPLAIGSTPVEMNVSTVSARTVRVTIQVLRSGKAEEIPSDGALVERDRGPALATIRTLPDPRTLKSGKLVLTIS